MESTTLHLPVNNVRPNKSRPKTSKPKRPLSAFNLFYRFKRQKVLNALSISRGMAKKDDIVNLVNAPPGLEESYHHHHDRPLPEDTTKEEANLNVNDEQQTEEQLLRGNSIRKDLSQHLLPRDTRKRSHRTNQSAMNGSMSFVELGKVMNASWKNNCDDYAKSVFNELAEEGRRVYRRRMEEYNATLLDVGMEVSSSLREKDVHVHVSAKAPPSHGVCEYEKRTPVLDAPHAHVSPLASPYSAFSALQNPTTEPLNQHQHTQLNHVHVHSGSHETERALQVRTKELEQQLVTERLRHRIRELEGGLASRWAAEGQLRTQLGTASLQNHGAMMASHHTASPIVSAAACTNNPILSVASAANVNMIHTTHPSSANTESRDTTTEAASVKKKDLAMMQWQQQMQNTSYYNDVHYPTKKQRLLYAEV